MLIGVRKRFIFIASSKTASTSIEHALSNHAEIHRPGNSERKHVPWKKVRNQYSFLFNLPEYSPETFFRFGVVREPVEWILSWYNYRRGNRIHSPLPNDMTFEQFWAGSEWLKKTSQKSKFIDNDGICRFDLIIPHEAVTKTFPVLMKKLKIPNVELPVKNESIGDKLSRSAIPSALITEINQYYQQDFDFWIEWQKTLNAGYMTSKD
jgi:hypothetical protein